MFVTPHGTVLTHSPDLVKCFDGVVPGHFKYFLIDGTVLLLLLCYTLI